MSRKWMPTLLSLVVKSADPEQLRMKTKISTI